MPKYGNFENRPVSRKPMTVRGAKIKFWTPVTSGARYGHFKNDIVHRKGLSVGRKRALILNPEIARE